MQSINHQAIELFDRQGHTVLCFSNLVAGSGIQANQFMIRDGNAAMLLDPGGDLTYTPLTIAATQYISLRDLDYVFASHQDPDIIASIDRWLLNTDCKVVVSELWSRFLPHLVSGFMDQKVGGTDGRILAVPDAGARLPFGNGELLILPAHFLHSVGNLHIYDPISKVLFSGDMGASLVDVETQGMEVKDFSQHIQYMEGFHKRYMGSQRACQLWANMVRKLDIEMLVPQHGQYLVGKQMVSDFLSWISHLRCGNDLIDQGGYSIPINRLV